MPSFSIPLSGLQADSTALNTIANNLSNLNTTAFKDQSTTFSDLFYQQLGATGSGDEIQVGAGTQVATTNTNFTTGSISNTGVASNLAINGDGFFVVQQNGVQELTRAGNFSVDSNGNLITATGQNVMGYPAANGVVNNNAALTAIQIPIGQVEQPHATSSFSINANLDASATAGTTTTSEVTVYDSLGTSHTLDVTYTKVSGSNNWTYSMDLDGNAAATSTGTLSFSNSGTLQGTTGALADGTSSAVGVSGISFALSDGANPLNMTWDLFNTSGTGDLTQDSAASATASTAQDGFASGQYSSFSVDSTGNVIVTFSNNQKQTVGQVALASVANEQGLIRNGDNSYSTTLASGSATVGVAGVGGRGTIQADSLEGSNVDTSTEFANLIVAQRAFEANSKAVTTFDSITQNVINMVSGQ